MLGSFDIHGVQAVMLERRHVRNNPACPDHHVCKIHITIGLELGKTETFSVTLFSDEFIRVDEK